MCQAAIILGPWLSPTPPSPSPCRGLDPSPPSSVGVLPASQQVMHVTQFTEHRDVAAASFPDFTLDS